VGLGFLVQITGINAFVSFSPTIIQEVGLQSTRETFLSALGALGGSLTFGIFLVLSIFAFFFVYALAPEVKGRQLEDIRSYWYNGGRWPQEEQEATVGAAGRGRL